MRAREGQKRPLQPRHEHPALLATRRPPSQLIDPTCWITVPTRHPGKKFYRAIPATHLPLPRAPKNLLIQTLAEARSERGNLTWSDVREGSHDPLVFTPSVRVCQHRYTIHLLSILIRHKAAFIKGQVESSYRCAWIRTARLSAIRPFTIPYDQIPTSERSPLISIQLWRSNRLFVQEICTRKTMQQHETNDRAFGVHQNSTKLLLNGACSRVCCIIQYCKQETCAAFSRTRSILFEKLIRFRLNGDNQSCNVFTMQVRSICQSSLSLSP
ncbi:hypothetical protein BaRGS_00014858 [Batillaria attramentaria]|uniref:Uncharacterized protein n=1 Tax=Batillaria attramentaria TaxID=370345 RepID=A0ABD0L366_9CAEN